MPPVNEAVIGEELQPHLRGADAVKEDLLDLQGVEVAVVMEGLKNAEAALGERAEEV